MSASASCHKHGYATEQLALDSMDWTLRRRVRDGHDGKVERRAYLCPACHQWHLTSMPFVPPAPQIRDGWTGGGRNRRCRPRH